jgi:serine/threonine protein kinase
MQRIRQIIGQPYNEDREEQVVDLLNQLSTVTSPGTYQQIENEAIQWKQRRNQRQPPNQNNIQVVRQIGAGGFGITELVKDRTTGIEYIRKKAVNINGNSDMEYQYRNLQYLRDQGICNDEFICPVLRYNQAGRTYILFDYLAGFRDVWDMSNISDNTKKNIGIKMVIAVQKLHRNNIVHLDLKLNNVMYNQQTGKVKIIDFGVSIRKRSDPDYRYTNRLGFNIWTAKPPSSTWSYEVGIGLHAVLRGRSHDVSWDDLIKMDYWALGVCLYNLMKGPNMRDLPFTNQDVEPTSYSMTQKNSELNNFYNFGQNIIFFQ